MLKDTNFGAPVIVAPKKTTPQLLSTSARGIANELADHNQQTKQALEQHHPLTPTIEDIQAELAALSTSALQENHVYLPKEITAEDLLNRRIESIPCLIEPIFQKVGLAALAGSSDVGKSVFLRQFAFAIATRQQYFMGWRIRAKYWSSIYVSSEDDENATAYLLYSLNKTQQRAPADCRNLRFIFETHDLLNELDKRLTAAPADLVIIDAFGDLYTGDANKTNQIRQFLNDYSQLAQKHQCLILWLHHTGKRTDEEAPSKHHVIGGQGFEGKMRLLIELRRDHYDNTRRHLCVLKGNYLPDEYKSESFVLRFDNFVFEPTGERVPFENLVKPRANSDEDKAKYERAIALQAQGYTLQGIADELGYSHKGAVSKLLKRHQNSEPKAAEVS